MQQTTHKVHKTSSEGLRGVCVGRPWEFGSGRPWVFRLRRPPDVRWGRPRDSKIGV